MPRSAIVIPYLSYVLLALALCFGIFFVIPNVFQKSAFGKAGAQHFDQAKPAHKQLGCQRCQNRFLNHVRYKPFRQSIDVAKALNTLPREDRESLEWLFRSFEEASYVLFGNKPMAFHCVKNVEPYKPQISDVYTFENSLTRFYLGSFGKIRGLEAWGKYKHLFPSSNFILVENSDPDLTTIYLINKRSFLKTVDENIDCFREVLGANATPLKIYEDCLRCKDLIKEGLENHDELLGILLGFGRHNARLFWRREQIRGLDKSAKFSLTKKPLIPSPKYSSIDEEYEQIHSRLDCFNHREADDFNPYLMSLPGFVADHEHPETQHLKIEYVKQYKTIIQRYKNRDFLETTLKQFCSE